MTKIWKDKLSGLDFIGAVNGTFFVGNTSLHTGEWAGFRVDAETVVSACTNNLDTSILDILGLVGATLPSGTIVRYGGDSIKTIQLTSGKVTLINV
jgi:hypothetical protein